MNNQYQQYQTTPSGERLHYGPPAAEMTRMSIALPDHYGPPEGSSTHESWVSHALSLVKNPYAEAQPQIRMTTVQAHAFAQKYAPQQYAAHFGIH